MSLHLRVFDVYVGCPTLVAHVSMGPDEARALSQALEKAVVVESNPNLK